MMMAMFSSFVSAMLQGNVYIYDNTRIIFSSTCHAKYVGDVVLNIYQ